MARPRKNSNATPAKERLLDAAFSLIRTKGYSATTVDDLCKVAEVTKGTFFHYFATKEALAVAAAEHWSSVTGELFKVAPYHRHSDPLIRFLGYIDFRKNILQGNLSEFTCLVGTMVQETYSTSQEIRDACKASIFGHAETLEADIEQAKDLYAPKAKWTAKAIALYTQAVIQGAFILAKASGDIGIAEQCLDQLRTHMMNLFNGSSPEQESITTA